jgi:acetyl esterase/lipase
MARDRKYRKPKGLLLVYPVTDRRMQTLSMQNFTDTPVWDAKLSKMMWQCYLGGKVPSPVEYASPAEAKSLKNFPPTYMEVAEFDCLHDEDIAYAERLKRDGVNVTLYNTSGTPHGFDAVSDSRITKKSIKIRVIQLKTAFKLHSERNKNERQNRN